MLSILINFRIKFLKKNGERNERLFDCEQNIYF
jgi:hypothetical protein